jgi:hypothetical protein
MRYPVSWKDVGMQEETLSYKTGMQKENFVQDVRNVGRKVLIRCWDEEMKVLIRCWKRRKESSDKMLG